ncbi:MAG: ATP-binding cassette domain-containing protein [Bacteroidia bacterium]|nr:ATP-binding cassette domain-containing protein [Bacteroidia bacterium]
MSFLRKNILIGTFQQVKRVLRPAQRARAVRLSLLVLLGSALDVVGLATVVPVILVAQEPQRIHSNAILSSIFEGMGFETDKGFILFMVLGMLGAFIVKNLLGFWISYIQGSFSYDIATDLSARQYRAYMAKDLAFIRENNSAKLITNVINIPRFFSAGILLPLTSFLSEILVVLFILIGILIYKWQLIVMLSLVMVPAFVLIYRSSRNKINSYGQEKKVIFPKAYNEMAQSLNGFIDIRLNHRLDFFFKRFIDYQYRLNDIHLYLYSFNIIPSRANELIAILGLVFIFLYGLFIADNPSELFVILSSFAVAAYRIMPSLNRMLSSLMSMKSHSYVFDILEDIFDPSVYGETQNRILPFKEEIKFNRLTYRYPSAPKPALDQVDFSVKKGEMIGLIGESGAGKSTFMNVFLRFLVEQEGQIELDGKKLGLDDTLAWWSMIGYVPQDVFILEGTVAENIAFGVKPDEIDHSRLQKAIEGANLRDFVENLELGLESQIGEKGAKISGGQRQRLGIARALYKNAEILLFDEATSALDPQNEREIIATIKALARAGKTVLVIAHRITTLEGCDRILELQEGTVVRTYNYRELLASSLYGEVGTD